MICPRQKSGMIVIGQFIHCCLQGRRIKICHMMHHCIFKCLRIPIHIFPVLIAVFLHTGQEPCKGFHKCIVVHQRIPLISLKPAVCIAVVFSQNQRVWIHFLYCPAELTPELMIILLGKAEIRRHIQTPAIHTVRRLQPFSCYIHNIFFQLWRLLVI